MAAFPQKQLYHCGLVGDMAAGNGETALMQPRPVTGFPPSQQIMQLVGGGWGRAGAVVAGNPPRLLSWGLASSVDATDAASGLSYVRSRFSDISFPAVART